VFERERKEKRERDRCFLFEYLKSKVVEVSETSQIESVVVPPVDFVEVGVEVNVYAPIEDDPNFVECSDPCQVVLSSRFLGEKLIEVQSIKQQVNVMRKKFRASASRSFVCVKCEAVLIGGLNADETQLKLTGVCRKCDPRRRCLKCTGSVLCIDHFKQSEIIFYQRDNYLKFQRNLSYDHLKGHGQVFTGKEYYLRPFETRASLDLILSDGVRKLARVKGRHVVCALDFECIDGDPFRVVEAGIAWYNGCCDTLKVENYRIHGYVGFDGFPNPAYCTNIYMTAGEMVQRLKTLVARFEYVVAFDSRLEAAVFDCMGIEKKFIDVQVLINPNRRERLCNVIPQFPCVQDTLHCAANDAYWIFLIMSRYRLKSDFTLFERSRMVKYLSTHCLVEDFATYFGRSGPCLFGSHVSELVTSRLERDDKDLVSLDSVGELKAIQDVDSHTACDFM
jgi:hypothetical protein